MSKYTTEVRFICETSSGLDESKGFDDVEKIIAQSVDKIFNFDFPIYDETYRKVLETKILKHYYTREIAFETVGLWKLKLSTKLNEIMPYYNKMYETETYEFNPLYDIDMYKDGNRDGSGNNRTTDSSKTNGSSSSNNSTLDAYQDTPQGGLSGVNELRYLTNARNTTSENENENEIETNRTNTSNISTTEEYAEHVYGKNGGNTYSKMIKEYRNILLNIDMMIIEELSDLFINLW